MADATVIALDKSATVKRLERKATYNGAMELK